MHFASGIVAADISGRYDNLTNPSVVPPAFAQTGYVYYSRPLYYPADFTAQSIGAHLTLASTSWWTNTFTVGTDGMTQLAVQSRKRLTTPADTEFALINVQRQRTSEAFNTSFHGVVAPNVTASLTLGMDHYSFPFVFWFTSGALNTFGSLAVDPASPVQVSRTITYNTGEFAQAQIGVADALFLTVALRVEQNSDFGDSLASPISPRFGVSYVRQLGDVSVKLRSSYGTAIRTPDPGDKIQIANAGSLFLGNPHLGPERQLGGDVGLDVVAGNRGSLAATYYNQFAKDLIDHVQIASIDSLPTYQYQNVGRVHNTGIEIEGTLTLGPVRAMGQYGYARARVDDLGSTYTGDQRLGDQVFVTPKHTAGATVAIGLSKATTLTGSLTYVGNWQNYDYLAEYRCFGGTGPCQQTGRGYIITYPSFVKARMTLAQQITRVLSGFAVVDNLANNEAFEQSNLYPVFGRVTSIGLQFHY